MPMFGDAYGLTKELKALLADYTKSDERDALFHTIIKSFGDDLDWFVEVLTEVRNEKERKSKSASARPRARNDDTAAQVEQIKQLMCLGRGVVFVVIPVGEEVLDDSERAIVPVSCFAGRRTHLSFSTAPPVTRRASDGSAGPTSAPWPGCLLAAFF